MTWLLLIWGAGVACGAFRMFVGTMRAKAVRPLGLRNESCGRCGSAAKSKRAIAGLRFAVATRTVPSVPASFAAAEMPV